MLEGFIIPRVLASLLPAGPDLELLELSALVELAEVPKDDTFDESFLPDLLLERKNK